MMKTFKAPLLVLAMGAALSVQSGVACAQAAEQYIPLLSFRIGFSATTGTGFFGGIIDYLNIVNAKGGINGVKMVWEECETEFIVSRGVECYERVKTRNGGASLIEPLSTGITYALLGKTREDKIPLTTLGYGRSDAADGRVFPYVFPLVTNYLNQTAGIIRFIGEKSGGMDKLKGKRIAYLYMDAAFGYEPIPVLQAEAKKHGFELIMIPVTPPGTEQNSQWLRIRRENPDYVVMWPTGVMTPTALKTAARNGYPSDRIIGSWWGGSEEEVVPAGEAGKGYISAGFTTPGNYPLLDEIRKLYAAGKGDLKEHGRIGSAYHTRGVVAGILMTEAIASAQSKFGVGKRMTPEQVRWGFENLNIDDKRQQELGVSGLFPTVKTSCLDHEGSGAIKMQQWDGAKWVSITPNWIVGDKALTRKLIEESAAKYAAENKITPVSCPN